MIHIKSFENIKGQAPEVGDYVILNVKVLDEKTLNLSNFVSSHVGKVMSINPKLSLVYLVYFDDIVTYFNSGEIQNTNSLRFDVNEISDFSKSKEELELKLSTKKYNI